MRNATSLSTGRCGNQRISTSDRSAVVSPGIFTIEHDTSFSPGLTCGTGWINGFGAVSGSSVGFNNATTTYAFAANNTSNLAEMSSPSQTYKLNSTTTTPTITTDYKSKISSKEASQKYSLSSVVSSKLH